LEQLSVFREKKNEWYEEWLLRLQAAINNRITTLQNEFIMAANSLLPDGSGDLESGNAWKMARNSFALKKTYSTENIFVEIEIVIKIR
jgi:hypothetical protein